MPLGLEGRRGGGGRARRMRIGQAFFQTLAIPATGGIIMFRNGFLLLAIGRNGFLARLWTVSWLSCEITTHLFVFCQFLPTALWWSTKSTALTAACLRRLNGS